MSKENSFINFSNPGEENRLFGVEIKNAMMEVLNKGQYILGEQVRLFERDFASYCGTKNCISTANGSDALVIALKSLGCKANDKIITVPNAGYYATSAILAIGAQPVYVDVCEQTMSISPDALEKALNEFDDIKCVIVTHLFGSIVNMDKISDLVSQHKTLLLEDCSQAHGAKFNGKLAGTIGNVGVYSFYPTKNLGAMGDAGAIITNSDDIFNKAVKLRQYGWGEKYKVELSNGQNSRMDEVQAAILNIKLRRLNELNALRISIVKRYASAPLEKIKVLYSDRGDFVAHLAVVRTQYRDELKEFLADNNIASEIHFPILDYNQLPNLRCNDQCKTAEKVVNEILSIPCHPTMEDDEVSYVISKLLDFEKTI